MRRVWLQQLRLGVVLWISVQEEQWLKRRRQPVLQVQRSVDSSVLTTRDFRVPSTDSTTVVASPLVCCSFRSETNLPTFFHDVMTRLKKRFWDVSCDLSMTKEILFEFPRYYDTHTLRRHQLCCRGMSLTSSLHGCFWGLLTLGNFSHDRSNIVDVCRAKLCSSDPTRCNGSQGYCAQPT